MIGKRTGRPLRGVKAHPLYWIWHGIRGRCLSPSHPLFKDYGGRGIALCPAWTVSFEAFVADMSPRPPGASIDRINNDGNYEPGNCRWATDAEQARNRRNTRLSLADVSAIRALSVSGSKQRELAARWAVSQSTISMIVNHQRWSTT